MRRFFSVLIFVLIIFSAVFFNVPAATAVVADEITASELEKAEQDEDMAAAKYYNSMKPFSFPVGSSDNISMNGYWKYNLLENNEIEITDYLGKSSSVEIPQYIDDYKITKVASAVFFENDILTEITIPPTVKEIGWWAFYGCTNLINVYFVEGLQNISYGAFMNCPNLKSVSIPISINKIDSDCFVYNCNVTTNVEDTYTGNKISTQSYTKKQDFTISGYSGTYAEKYAADEKLNFVSKGTVYFGDVNCDGNISSDDVTLIKNHIAGAIALDDIQKRNADVDYNGKIDSADCKMIERCISNDYSEKAMPAAKSLYSADNYLYGKSIYCDGDSIARGTGTNILGNGYYSYCNYIADANNMTLTQRAVPGTTLAVQDSKTGSNKSITERILEMKGKYDFILLEGGFNDLFQKISAGTVTSRSNRSGNYDKYTTAGAMETICYFLNKNYRNTPALFVICPKRYAIANQEIYWNVIREALDKWEIPYIDFSTETDFADLNQTICDQYYRYTERDKGGDGTHPLKYAHEKIFAPMIQEKLNLLVAEYANIKAESTSVSLGMGENYQFSAKSDYAETNFECSWTSDNPSVVSVQKNGLASAINTGTANLKLCSKNNKTAYCKVTVKSAPDSVSLCDTNLSLGKGETYIISESTNSGSYAKTFTWSSSNENVATVEKTVSNKAKITAKRAGKAVITIKTYNGKTATCNVTVKDEPTSVKLSDTNIILGKNETFIISESTNTGSYAKNFTWSSSNSKVASVEKTVSNKAKITAKSNGTTDITIKTYNGKTAVCKVTVKNAPTSIKLSETNIILGKNETFIISESTNAGSYAKNFTWSSSNSKVASVTKTEKNKAKIIAKGTGTAIITVKTYNGKLATCKVTVKNAPSSVKLSTTNLKLYKGSSYVISESTNSGSYAKAFTWSSSNPKVASVTKGEKNKAKITAVNKGTASITITTYNGKKAVCKVTVV